MPTFNEINGLRKSGDLDGARVAALETLKSKPHDKFIQGAYGWVLYEQLKRDIDAFEKSEVSLEHLIGTLNQVADEYRRLDALQKPELLHSRLFSLMLKTADNWPEFIPFARWWGFENFRDDDCKPFTPSNGGRPIPSIQMRAFYVVGKAITRGHVSDENMSWALDTLDAALCSYPDDIWLNHYKAKSLLACNRRVEALNFALPVLMRKIRSAWAWSLLGQIIEPNDLKEAIVCYYRAINLAGQPTEVLKTRVKLARLLAKVDRFAEAATQVRKARHDREEAGWRIDQDLQELLDAAWYKQQSSQNMQEPNMENASLEILYKIYPNGFTHKTGVLESHNLTKELVYVAFTSRDGITVPYRCNKELRKMSTGTILDTSMVMSDGHQQVVSVRKSNKKDIPELIANVSGLIHLAEGRPFAFIVLKSGERVYVSPDIVTKYDLVDGSIVTGEAVRSVEKKSGNEGWKLLKLNIA